MTCKKCGDKAKRLYYELCQDCLDIRYECGCEAQFVFSGKNQGYWQVAVLCTEHDATAEQESGE